VFGVKQAEMAYFSLRCKHFLVYFAGARPSLANPEAVHMKLPRIKPTMLLTLLSAIGLTSACGDINDGPIKPLATTPVPDISGELTKLGRLKIEDSSVLMTTGTSCFGGGRTNM